MPVSLLLAGLSIILMAVGYMKKLSSLNKEPNDEDETKHLARKMKKFR
jgi:hypothetical protein